MNKDKAAKFGRFAFILPYIITPIVLMLQYPEENKWDAFLYAFFLPFGIESPVIFLYPVCLTITVISLIICGKNSKKTDDKKEKRANKIITGVIIGIIILVILAVVDFIRNFRIVF